MCNILSQVDAGQIISRRIFCYIYSHLHFMLYCQWGHIHVVPDEPNITDLLICTRYFYNNLILTSIPYHTKTSLCIYVLRKKI